MKRTAEIPAGNVTHAIRARNKRRRDFFKNKELFFLSLPAVLFFTVFTYIPLFGIIVAFKKFNYALGLWGSEWVGFKNFEFFFQSEIAFRVTRNTILYNGGFIVLTTFFAVSFAIMLTEIGKRWLKFHQTAMFLPYFLSWVVVSYVSSGFLEDNGFMNALLKQIGVAPIQWYMEAKYWPYILVFVQLWKGVGFATLIYYAGIIGIDQSYYEAARIDGASKLQMVTKITVPLILPLIIILFIVSVGGIFRADFGLFYFIPNNTSFLFETTDVIDTYVYRALKQSGDIGMSTAVGLYQSVVGFMLVLTANYTIKKMNADNALW